MWNEAFSVELSLNGRYPIGHRQVGRVDATKLAFMPLTVTVAHFSATGPRARNEDFAGCVTPHGADLASKGFAAVVADGVFGAGGGREAAEHCARNVLADYYATPDTWEASQSLDKIYSALNRWVQTQARASPDLVSMATTLTTLVLRGSIYHFAHVGDTRIYLLRDGALQSLTTDHVWQRPEMEHVLTRAVGLDTSVTADHGFGPVRPGDVFALVSDGVWASLAATDLQRELSHAATSKDSVEHVARSIVEYAHQLGGKDNATALVVRVEDVDANALRDVLQTASELPALPPLDVGQVFDGFNILERMHLSRVTVLYRVRDSHVANGRELAMKALTREAHADAHERLAFANERWLRQCRAGDPIVQAGLRTSFFADLRSILCSGLRQRRSFCWWLSKGRCPQLRREKILCVSRWQRAIGCGRGR